MGGVFSKPKAPDNSAQLAEMARQREEADALKKKAEEEAATEKKRQTDLQERLRRGRASLLGTDGGELGVQ